MMGIGGSLARSPFFHFLEILKGKFEFFDIVVNESQELEQVSNLYQCGVSVTITHTRANLQAVEDSKILLCKPQFL